jgi:invasion protein IalB
MPNLLFALLAASCALGAARLAFAEEPAQLDYTLWTKACKSDAGDGEGRVCLTSSSGKLPSANKNAGQINVSAILVEREDDSRRTLRIVVALGTQLVHGTRIRVDNHMPVQAAYANCYKGGCFSDYILNDDLLESLERGDHLVVQAIDANGSPSTRTIPLAGLEVAFSNSPSGWNDLEGSVRNLLDGMLALKSDVGKLDSASGLIATPWTKLCFKGQDGKARQVCFTGKNAHVGSGPTVLAAVAIDPEGEPKKLLRVTLPLRRRHRQRRLRQCRQ